MRKALKIGLIALAVVAIGAVIGLTLFHHENDIKQVNVSDSYFTAQLKAQSEKEIDNGQSFDNIMRAYNAMLQAVDDAAYLENIDSTEATSCRKLLAYSYAPRLTSYAQECFKRSEWDVSLIDTLRHEAQGLSRSGILPGDSHDLPRLHDIINTVDDYHAAVAATHVGSITTVEAAQAAIARARSFHRAPLTNCHSLVAALNAVPEKAKASLAQNIVAACQRHSASTDVLIDRINKYVKAFGGNSQLYHEKSLLERACKT